MFKIFNIIIASSQDNNISSSNSWQKSKEAHFLTLWTVDFVHNNENTIDIEVISARWMMPLLFLRYRHFHFYSFNQVLSKRERVSWFKPSAVVQQIEHQGGGFVPNVCRDTRSHHNANNIRYNIYRCPYYSCIIPVLYSSEVNVRNLQYKMGLTFISNLFLAPLHRISDV